MLSSAIGSPPKGKAVVVLGSEVLQLVLLKDFSRLQVVLTLVVVVEAVLELLLESWSWI